MKSSAVVLLASSIVLHAIPEDVLGQWEPFDGPEAAQINDIEAHGAYLFASTDEGIYRSADDGKTWVAVNSGLPMDTYYIFLAAIGRDLFVIIESGDTMRVLRTSDDGRSWVDISNGLPDQLFFLAVIEERLFLLGEDSVSLKSHIYRSEDHGNSWRPVNEETTISSPLDYLIAYGDFLFAVGEDRVYRSSDYGDSWTLIADEKLWAKIWAEEKKGSAAGVGVSLVAAGDSLFASALVDEYAIRRPLVGAHVHSYKTYEAMFHSIDNGQNWTLLSWGEYSESMGGMLFNDVVSSGGALYAGTGDGIYRSTTNGETWRRANVGLPGYERNETSLSLVTTLAVAGETLFAFTSDGAYTSADGGKNWTAANAGLPANIYITWVAVSDGKVYASLGSHGVYISRDFGNSWESIGTGSKLTGVGAMTSTSAGLFVSTERELYRSVDNGDSWTSMKPTRFSHSLASSIQIIVDSDLYVDTFHGIYRSSDDGESWKDLGPGSDPEERHYYQLVVNGDNLIVSGFRGRLHRSTDRGESWAKLDPALYNDNYLVQIVRIEETLFGSDSAGGVLMSIDRGDSWVQINNGLPPPPRPANPGWGVQKAQLVVMGGQLFAHAHAGLFIFDEDDEAWSPVNRGLPESEMKVAAAGQNLFAYTRDAGIWRLRMSQLPGALD